MSNFDNPTADDLILLGAAQRNHLKRLEALTSWSEEDAENALLSHHVYLDEQQLWAVSVADLTKIADDARCPARYVSFLRPMIQWANINNQTHIHPKSKYNDTSN